MATPVTSECFATPNAVAFAARAAAFAITDGSCITGILLCAVCNGEDLRLHWGQERLTGVVYPRSERGRWLAGQALPADRESSASLKSFSSGIRAKRAAAHPSSPSDVFSIVNPKELNNWADHLSSNEPSGGMDDAVFWVVAIARVAGVRRSHRLWRGVLTTASEPVGYQ
jgi:hypothetical protein